MHCQQNIKKAIFEFFLHAENENHDILKEDYVRIFGIFKS